MGWKQQELIFRDLVKNQYSKKQHFCANLDWIKIVFTYGTSLSYKNDLCHIILKSHYNEQRYRPETMKVQIQHFCANFQQNCTKFAVCHYIVVMITSTKFHQDRIKTVPITARTDQPTDTVTNKQTNRPTNQPTDQPTCWLLYTPSKLRLGGYKYRLNQKIQPAKG